MRTSAQELHDHSWEVWKRMPPRLRLVATEHLDEVLPEEFKQWAREHIAASGVDWVDTIGAADPLYTFHFAHGMQIRNLLRDVVKDDETPTGNWDDCYVAALEEALEVGP